MTNVPEEILTTSFVCSHCSKKFKYESEKRRHEQSHISPKYDCNVCFKKFSFLSALRRHEKQHERKGSVECMECGRNFRDEILLKRHIKYAHIEEIHTCTKCGVQCPSEIALRAHFKTHNVEGQRQYKCSHGSCTKSFNFLHHLKHHELTHTESKQHYCSYCGKGFIQGHHLKTHMKNHEPEQWLVCSMDKCKKKFPNKYALKRHLLTHKSVKKTLDETKVIDNILQPASNMEDQTICGSLSKEKEEMRNKTPVSPKTRKIDSQFTKPDKENEETLSNESCPESNINSSGKADIGVDDTAEISNFDSIRPQKCVEFNDANNMTDIDEFVNSNDVVKDVTETGDSLHERFNLLTMQNLFNCDNDSTRSIIDNNEFEHRINDLTELDYNDCKSALGVCLVSEAGVDCLCDEMCVKNDNEIKEKGFDVISNNKHVKFNQSSLNEKDERTNRNDRDENMNSLKVSEESDRNNIFDVPYNSCKAIFGNCIVSGDDTMGEGCLCAKMCSADGGSAQEIEDITPMVQVTWS